MQGGILVYFFSFLSFFLISLFSGYLLLRLSGISEHIKGLYTRGFVCSLCGLVFLVLLYSLVKSGGFTVNIFFPVIFALLYFSERKPILTPVKTEGESVYQVIIIMALTVLFPFLYFLFVMFKGGNIPWNGVDYDNVMYAKLAEELANSGLENKWFMYFSDTSKVRGLEPYHYFESWTNALCHQVFNTNLVLGFYLVVYPLLLSISILGVLALFEHFKKPGWTDFIISIALLFLGPIYQIKMSGYQENRMSCEIPWQCYGEKFSVYYPFILSSLLLLLKGYKLRVHIVLLCLCIVSSTLFPAILLFYFGLILFSKHLRKGLLLTVVPFLIVFILVYVFNSPTKNSSSNPNELLGYSDLATAEFSMTWFKLALSNFAFSVFIILKSFFSGYFWIVPLFFLAFKILERTFLKDVSSLLVFCICGLCVSSFLFRHPDSHQLFSNSLTVLHGVLICLVICLLCQHNKSKLESNGLKVVVVLLAFNNAICSLMAYKEAQKNNNVSDEYLMTAWTLTKGNPSKKVGLICTPADYVNYFVQRKKNSLYFLSYLDLDPLPINLSSPEIKSVPDSLLWKQDYPLIRKSDAFYGFIEGKKGDMDSLRALFIERTGLKYILITPNHPYPAFLEKFHPKTLCDSATKLRLIRLK